MKRYLIGGAIVVALVSAGAVFAVTGDEPPASPPWLREDGTVDVAKVPEAVEVSGPDGEIVVCSNGRRLKVRKALLFGPPAATPAQLRVRGDAGGGGDLVWRCGLGADPHLNPRLIPADQDPLRRRE